MPCKEIKSGKYSNCKVCVIQHAHGCMQYLLYFTMFLYAVFFPSDGFLFVLNLWIHVEKLDPFLLLFRFVLYLIVYGTCNIIFSNSLFMVHSFCYSIQFGVVCSIFLVGLSAISRTVLVYLD